MTIQRILFAKRSLILPTEVAKYQSIRTASSSNHNSSHDDYQYLQRGQIPMLHFQRSLPRLPIPKLEQTCTRFLAAVRPIIDATEYDNLVGLVQQFQSTGTGPELQRLLIAHDKANLETSYISLPWFDMYLSDRRPLPINYTPVLIMKPDARPEYNDQLTKTSNLVVTTLRFMRSLRENLLEPEVYHLNPKKSDTDRYRRIMRNTPTLIATFVSYAFKAFPLDMSQYQGLFGGTRIPEKGKDRIYRTTKSTHITVMRNGHIYAVNVLDGEGNIVPPSAIINRLRFVLNDPASQKAAEYPLGVLTSQNRDKWATIREHLVKIHNEKSLEIVDSALFCVSLDEDDAFDLAEPVPIVENMLYGNQRGLYNRWFDKSISLIVTKDGTSGVSFEHSWGDGVAVLRLFNEIYKETTESPVIQPSDVATTPAQDVSDDIIHVDFNLDDKAKLDITEALANYRATVNSMSMHALIYTEMNKGFCKNHKVSPDAIMQLGFQLAYAKQHGEYVGTYESCSTAAFRHGRTETVRPCTMDTKAFCESIVHSTSATAALNKSQQRDLIVKCSQTHGQLNKEAAMGQGFDRHLFGLKYTAQLNKIPLDPLYEHNAYRKINCNILSTSTLTSSGLYAGGFGPVEANGYGIGYNINDEFLGTIVTHYTKQRNGSEFIDCLRESYDEIRKILEAK